VGAGTAGIFVTARKFSAGMDPVSVGVGDFNGDGNRDLAVANSGSNDVSVLLGKGDGTFEAAVNFPVGGSPNSVAVSYFNGDSIQDLAVESAGSSGATSIAEKEELQWTKAKSLLSGKNQHPSLARARTETEPGNNQAGGSTILRLPIVFHSCTKSNRGSRTINIPPMSFTFDSPPKLNN
jgi:hypothetical protein